MISTTAEGITLAALFGTGMRALELEDRRLALVFAQAHHQREHRNRGLAYTVFETTLVYEIFKAWLPMVEVYWEYPYPDDPGSKADLVVFDKQGPSAVVEAKWWMNNHQKTLHALDQDVAKLRSWKGPVRHRVLLCFWYSRDDQWSRDLGDVREYCQRDAALALLCADRFPTQLYGVASAYFAVAALAVT